MKQYLDVLRDIKDNGYNHSDRTGEGRRSINGVMLKFDLSDGTIPLVTTREINTKTLIAELLWFISGSSNNKLLKDMGSSIWSRWAVTEQDINEFIDSINVDDGVQIRDDDGEIHFIESDEARKFMLDRLSKDFTDSVGPIYGPHWRNAPISEQTHRSRVSLDRMPSDKLKIYEEVYAQQNTIGDKTDYDQEEFELFCNSMYSGSIDQLNELIVGLKHNPYSSRHVVNCWIPEHIPYEELSPAMNVLLGKGALAPCHMFYQCFVMPPKSLEDKPQLSLLIYLRSNDAPVGQPFNLAQYGILLHLLAHVCDYDVGTLTYMGGDVHIYLPHEALLDEQLSREPLPLPGIWINPDCKDIFAMTMDDIRIEGYQSHPPINYPVFK